MQFVQTTRSTEWTNRLQFYKNPPFKKIAIDELESLAVDRLKVLKIMETCGQDHIRGSKEYDQKVRVELEKLQSFGKIFLATSSQVKMAKEDIERDLLSHFILQVAYCRHDDQRRWFIHQECDLFRFRVNSETNPMAVNKFLHENDLNFYQLSDEERAELADKLIDYSSNSPSTFYKVVFTDVPELVRSRKVYLHLGFAYVCDFAALVTSRFRQELSHGLSRLSLTLSSSLVDEETRVMPLLASLSKRYLGTTEYKANVSGNQVTADKVEEQARDAGLFPPCMQQLHESLRAIKHLRHQGRRQYGLFLKGIGLSLEESLKFWRQAFAPKTTGEAFAKQYAYNIRHCYGKEGKRVDQAPLSCVTIIMGPAPAAGEAHGCPFRHMDLELLRQRLYARPGATSESVNSIVQYSKDKHFNLACREYFKMANQLTPEQAASIVIMNPNQYYDQAMTLRKNPQTGFKTTVRRVHAPAKQPATTTQDTLTEEDESALSLMEFE